MKANGSRLVARASWRVGTRGSELARRQAAIVVEAIQRIEPAIGCEIQVIRTHGDEWPGMDVSQFEGQGVFVRRIEAELLKGTIHVAVHSFKDMPSLATEGLIIAAFPPRDDPRDALITRSGAGLADLPRGAIVGTGSPRRRALLLEARPDLHVRPIRGNVDTRLRRLAEGDLDGVALAAAGLERLGRAGEITERLDPTVFIPAVGQGILAIQVRAADGRVELLHALDDGQTRVCAAAERAVAVEVGAGCQEPIGAYARIVSGRLEIDACIAPKDGQRVHRAHEEGGPADAVEIGARLGASLRRSVEAQR